MRYLLGVILVSMLGIHSMLGNIVVTRDSLLNVIKKSADISQQIATYRNLADLYFEKPEEIGYLNEMYLAAKTADDKEQMINALSDLSFNYIKSFDSDSALYYMHILEKSGEPEEVLPSLSYLRMRLFEGRLRYNEREKGIEDELNFLNNTVVDKQNIYIQIERAYTTGFALYSNEKFCEAEPYLNTARKLVEKLPYKEGYDFRIFTLWAYAHLVKYLDKGELFIEYVETLLQLYKNYYELYYARQRPFYNINVRYLQCYSALFMCINKLPEEKIDHYFKLIKEMSTQVTDPIDKYNCFSAMNNYSLLKEDYANALSTNDSLIKYTRKLNPSNIPGLFNISSQIYEEMGDYKNALKYHKMYQQAKDSLESSDLKGKLNELQVRYDVDKLNYEKSQLENKNRRIFLITLGFVLFLVTGICAYLYYDLKRERRMKKTLGILNQKAEESEKMKTAFINSMCHEIRTPLNAIVGFAGILTDMPIDDEEMKKEYNNMISLNAKLLTSLIDHLLVVANLDSSEELLPCERTNIKNVCKQEMIKVEQWAKPGIAYQLELPDEEIFISTNEQYLSLVIENLLNNANKFTESGSITLGIWLDKAQGRLRIDVTDTGRGIPLDKQEVVFQRFSKLDEYVQGNGLGLYLCRLIVKRLSGTIFVDPDYTNGARLIIYLPI